MKLIFDTCVPRQDVLSGDLREEMFAARLRDVIREQAGPLLTQAAFLEMLLASPDLFDDPRVAMCGFTAESVQALRRRGYPYAPIMKHVATEDLTLSPTDPYYLKAKDDSSGQNRKRLEAVKTRIEDLIEPIMKGM